jgi:hypothetical protein
MPRFNWKNLAWKTLFLTVINAEITQKIFIGKEIAAVYRPPN